MGEKTIKILKEGLGHFEKSILRLSTSHKDIEEIDFSEEVTDDQLKELESLSARFARASDLFTQKVLKSIVLYLGEELISVRDRLNFAEKLEIITSAEEWMLIRSVRNQIVHDYIEEDLISHHDQIINLSKSIISEAEKVIEYVRNLEL